MKRIIVVGFVFCFLIGSLIFTEMSIGAKVSGQYKSRYPKKAFLKSMKEHYHNCESKNHLEDFIYLALGAGLESYYIDEVPQITSVAILPPTRRFAFNRGIIAGLSANLKDRDNYRIISSEESFEIIKKNDFLTDYSLFLDEFIDFNNINKERLDKLAKFLKVDYLLMTNIAEYRSGVDNRYVVILSYSVDLHLFNVKEAKVSWLLRSIARSSEFSKMSAPAVVLNLLAWGPGSMVTTGKTELQPGVTIDEDEFKDLSLIKNLVEIITTLDKYDLTGKQGVPDKEIEYKIWLKTGELTVY